EELSVSGMELPRRDGADRVELVEGVFDQCQAEQQIPPIDGHLRCQGNSRRQPAAVDGFCTAELAKPDGGHLAQPALDVAAEAGMWLHPGDNDRPIRFAGEAV